MQFNNKVKKIKKYFLFKYLLKVIEKTFYKIYKKQIINSFISSILRLISRFKISFRIYFLLKKSNDIKLIKQFWIIRIGFTRKRKYSPFIKFDSYISNNPFCCSNLRNLPFASETCQRIKVGTRRRCFPRLRLPR